jgi:hypothetical protein
MSNFVVFDTSIFLDHLRTGRHQQRIEATGLVRNSAVVLAERSLPSLSVEGSRLPDVSPFLPSLAFALRGWFSVSVLPRC